jgi:two-component system phosphate regulon sensor histidine kinase PhoR
MLECEAISAMNGAEALQQISTRPPDLILLDILLPDISGLDVCRWIRSQSAWTNVPIIAITVSTDAAIRQQTLDAGADDFIAKPLDLLELRTRIASGLRTSHYRQLLQERVRRQQAEEELRRRNRELTLLNQFITTRGQWLFSPAPQLEALLYNACQTLHEALDLVWTCAWMPDEERGMTLTVCIPEYTAITLSRQTLFAIVQAHMPVDQVEVLDPETIDAPGMRAWLRVHPVATMLLVPIPVHGTACGVMIGLSATSRIFDQRDRAFGQSLGSALGQGIELALLYRQHQNHIENLEKLVAHRTHELQIERDRTHAILEALGEGVTVTDADSTIRYANPAMAELSGYTVSELIGRHWCDMQQNETTIELCHYIQRYVETGRTWRGELEVRRRDGTTYDAAITVAPVFDPNHPDMLAGMVSIQRDITPIKEAERAKDRFISNISHELRTPLSIITLHSGNLDILFDRLDADQRRRLVREIRTHADILNDLLEDVLELSRINSGHLHMEERPVDLGELLASEGEQLRILAEQKGLHFEVKAQLNLIVRGDETLLRRIIRNLISNAVKFTQPGGRILAEVALMEPLISTVQAWPGYADMESREWIGLRVIDSGIGIAPEHLSRLFDRFYRVRNQVGAPGTGLGLSITRELVTRHGGWMGVASKPGEGSTFACYFPHATS